MVFPPHRLTCATLLLGHDLVHFPLLPHQAARAEAAQMSLREELSLAQRDAAAGENATRRAEQRASDLTTELRAVREVKMMQSLLLP